MPESDHRTPWHIKPKLAQLRALPHRCAVCDTPPDEMRVEWLTSLQAFIFIVTCHGHLMIETVKQVDFDEKVGIKEPVYDWFIGDSRETDAGMGPQS